MKNKMELWSALNKGVLVSLEDAAMALYGVDVSSYIKTVDSRNLKRFRRNERGCDGTAILTLETLHEMIEPIVNQRCWDREKGDPKGNEIGIKYYCSPIEYKREFRKGKLMSGYEGDIQIDIFRITYDSEFIYEK